jgi:hypothetical protein
LSSSNVGPELSDRGSNIGDTMKNQNLIPEIVWNEITAVSQKIGQRKVDPIVSAANIKRAFLQARILRKIEGEEARDQGALLMAMAAIANKKGEFSATEDALATAIGVLASMMAQVLEAVELSASFEREEDQRFIDWLEDRNLPN